VYLQPEDAMHGVSALDEFPMHRSFGIQLPGVFIPQPPCEIIQSIVSSIRTIYYFTGQTHMPPHPPSLSHIPGTQGGYLTRIIHKPKNKGFFNNDSRDFHI
jgi:hypothetical protein